MILNFFTRIIRYYQIKFKNPSLINNSLNVSHKATFLGQNWVGRNVRVEPGVVIGKYSYINENSVIISGIIKSYVSIGYGVLIGPDEHPLNVETTSPKAFSKFNIEFQQHKPSPIIGNDVWIGAHAVILRGVTIGDGAVIAAGAIVNKDVKEFDIVGGVPAKVISRRPCRVSDWYEDETTF